MAIPLTVGRGLPPGAGAVGAYGAGWSQYPGLAPKPKPPVPQNTTPTSMGTNYGSGWGGVNAPNDPAPVYTPIGVNVAAPSFGTPGGGGNVDWASMIGGSYEVAQAEAMMGAQSARAKASLQNMLRTNLIDLGIGSKTDLGDLSKYIDKDTLKQAIANKYSTYAQVADQQARANATNDAQLAARGILSSGQTTKSGQDVTNQAEQARYTGLREFLRSGQAGIEHLGDVKAQLAQGVMQARFAAAARLAQQYATAGMGGGTALGSAPSAPAPAPATSLIPTGWEPQYIDLIRGTDPMSWLR